MDGGDGWSVRHFVNTTTHTNPQELDDEVLDAPPPTVEVNNATAGMSGNTGEFDIGDAPLPPPYQRTSTVGTAPPATPLTPMPLVEKVAAA